MKIITISRQQQAQNYFSFDVKKMQNQREKARIDTQSKSINTPIHIISTYQGKTIQISNFTISKKQPKGVGEDYLKASNGVGSNGGIGTAHMRRAVDVIKGCSEDKSVRGRLILLRTAAEESRPRRRD